MFVSVDMFDRRISAIPRRFVKIHDLDTGKEVEAIWEDDSTGEYCQYVRKDGKVQSVSVCGRSPIPKKQICYGNIRIIDVRKEKLVDGKIVPV